MTYNSKSQFFLIMLLILFTSCSQKAIKVSTQSFRSGDTSFMNDTLQGFVKLPDSEVMLRSTHSNDSLIVEVKINERATLRSVLTNGISIWIDPKTERNENYGMTFTAARSEMFRRRDEIAQSNQKADSAAIALYTIRTWVEAVNQREIVVTDVKGTRFSDKDHAQAFLDQEGNLIYFIKMGFAQLGITPENNSSVSVGVISQVHQAQLLNSGQGSVGGPPGTGMRRQPGSNPGAQIRTPQIAVNSWIIVTLNNDTSSEIQPMVSEPEIGQD
jgi:hypothetical protein